MINLKNYKKPMGILFLSAFVLPGLGQFVNRQILKGIMVLMGTLLPFISLISYVVYFYVKNLTTLFDTIADTTATEFSFASISIPLVIALFLTSLLFYFYGAIDAYVVANNRIRKEFENNKEV